MFLVVLAYFALWFIKFIWYLLSFLWTVT